MGAGTRFGAQVGHVRHRQVATRLRPTRPAFSRQPAQTGCPPPAGKSRRQALASRCRAPRPTPCPAHDAASATCTPGQQCIWTSVSPCTHPQRSPAHVFSQTLTNHGAGCCVLAQAAARSRRRGRWCRRSWSTRFWAVASQRSIPRQPGPGRAACQVLVAACCCRGTWRSANASCVCADLKSKWELLIRTASQEAHIIKSQEYILTLHASMPRH